MIDDLFDKMIRAAEAVKVSGAKPYIQFNETAQAHIRWLVANGHMMADEISIEAVMAADKKLGITPWDWPTFS